MKEALLLAKKAASQGDIPIGVVIVKDRKIIGRGHNCKEQRKDATKHAELLALEDAANTLGEWWLEDCTMYVTLEPCSMCAGALINTRISKVVIGAKNERFGACGSAIDLLNSPASNHHVEVSFGVMEKECQKILSDFFSDMRRKKAEEI